MIPTLFDNPGFIETRKSINQSSEAQERRSPGWQDIALAFLKEYARTHDEFLSETMRDASKGVIEQPPNAGPWGAVVKKAKAAGIIVWSDKMDHQKTPSSHGDLKKVWKSLIFNQQVAK